MPDLRHLVESFGVEVARGYAASNQQALDWIAAVVAERGIDCDFERASNYVYTETAATCRSSSARRRPRARQASRRADDRDRFAVPGRAAVRVDAQAQFHPWKYVTALAEAVAAGADSLEETRATDVRGNDPCVVETPAGSIRAAHVDRRDATAVPRPRAFLREGPPAEVVRDRGDATTLLVDMYISAERPMRSIRSAPGPTVGGCSSSVARVTSPARSRTRASVMRGSSVHARALRRPRPSYRWSTHDFMPAIACPTSDGCGAATTHPRRDRLCKMGSDQGHARRRSSSMRVLGRPNGGLTVRGDTPRSAAIRPAAHDRERQGRLPVRRRPARGRGQPRRGRWPGPRRRPGGALGTRQYAVHRDDEGNCTRCPRGARISAASSGGTRPIAPGSVRATARGSQRTGRSCRGRRPRICRRARSLGT